MMITYFQNMSSGFSRMIHRRQRALRVLDGAVAGRRGALMEALEQRALLAAVSWDGGGDGANWSDAKNWSADQVPGVGDEITVGGATVLVSGGLTIDGSLTLGDGGKLGGLTFVGTQTLGGTGKVLMGNNLGNAIFASGDGGVNPATLTIGAGLTIASGKGTKGLISGEHKGDLIINEGTISADGGRFELSAIANSGSVSATGGGSLLIGGTWSSSGVVSATESVLELAGDWSNTGTITATDATTSLGGNLSAAALGVFNRTGGEVSLVGVYDNTGQTLAITEATGFWKLRGGTVKGGTLTGSPAARLEATFLGGALDGVTMSGEALDLSAGLVRVHNGLTLSGILRVGRENGLDGQLHFMGTQTLGGTGLVLSDGQSTFNAIHVKGDGGENPAVLTIGPGISMEAPASAFLGVLSSNKGDSIINQGTLTAQGGSIQITGLSQNLGVIEAFSTFGSAVADGVDVPTTVLTGSPSEVLEGEDVSIAWDVTVPVGEPAGSVSVFDGDVLLFTGGLSGTKVLSGLSAGLHALTAKYSGDGTFINNRSRALTVTVTEEVVLTVTGTESVTAPRTTAVGSLDITFSEEVNLGSFTFESVTLTRDGGANLIEEDSGVTLTLVSGTTYRIGGLAALTGQTGAYSLKLVDGGLTSVTGAVLETGTEIAWAMQPTVKNLSSFPAPRTVPVLSPAIRLSEAAGSGTFTFEDITLTRDGGGNIATSGITVTQSPSDPALYTIKLPASLASSVGTYSLTVTGAGIGNAAGTVAFAGASSTSWTIVAAVPSAPVLDGSSEGKAGSGFTQFTTPTVKGTASPGSTVEVFEGATLKGSALVGSDGKYLVTLSTLSVGVHTLKARATDGIGAPTGNSADATITVETATPTIVSMSVYSAPRTVAVGSTGIRFSSQIDLSTFNVGDMVLTRNGVPVSLAGATVTVSPTDSKLYTIVIPAASNTADGVYVLTVTGSGIKNLAGKSVGNNFSTTWTKLPQIMNMSQYTAPRTAPVTALGIRFSNPITLSSFTLADITLTRNGGGNLATSGITVVVSGSDPSVYTILIPSSLTSTAGAYVLTVIGSGIQTPGGFTVSNNMSTSWVQL